MSQTFRESHPQIPWAGIVALRNRLIHGYDTIDVDILWKVVTVDMPALIALLEQLDPANGK